MRAAFFLLVCSVWSSIAIAASTLTVNPLATDGILTVCPGDFISITCAFTTNEIGVSVWDISGTQSSDCVMAVSHGEPQDTVCGLFTISMITGPPNAIFSSTAQTTATTALNGAVVECFNSGLASPDTLVGNVTIHVLSGPATITSVQQVSQSVVRVSMSVADSQCVGSYLVEATPVGGSGSTNTSSHTPTVDVSGLDVCQYNYSFVGSGLTRGGVLLEQSLSFNFSADLSVLNKITVTINQVDPLIEWVQGDNSGYPTCITGYTLEDQFTSRSTTVDSTTRSLTAQQLNDAGFPYCTSIQPTVTPITPMGPLEIVQAPNEFDLLDPDFPLPLLSSVFSISNGSIHLQINTQSDLDSKVQIRSYHYITSGANSSVMDFTDDHFVIELPGFEAGQIVLTTVTFKRLLCKSSVNFAINVPMFEISDVTQGQPTVTSQTVTITLPLTEYQPEQLLIISTASAPGEDDVTVMADFTSPSAQYTVTFISLDPITEYTFTIRIALHTNNTVDVVPAVSGIFTTLSPAIPLSGCDIMCITTTGAVVGSVVVLLLLILVAIIGTTLALRAHSKRGSISLNQTHDSASSLPYTQTTNFTDSPTDRNLFTYVNVGAASLSSASQLSYQGDRDQTSAQREISSNNYNRSRETDIREYANIGPPLHGPCSNQQQTAVHHGDGQQQQVYDDASSQQQANHVEAGHQQQVSHGSSHDDNVQQQVNHGSHNDSVQQQMASGHQQVYHGNHDAGIQQQAYHGDHNTIDRQQVHCGIHDASNQQQQFQVYHNTSDQQQGVYHGGHDTSNHQQGYYGDHDASHQQQVHSEHHDAVPMQHQMTGYSSLTRQVSLV